MIAVVLKKGDTLNATKDVPAEQTNETLAEDVAATRKERGDNEPEGGRNDEGGNWGTCRRRS